MLFPTSCLDIPIKSAIVDIFALAHSLESMEVNYAYMRIFRAARALLKISQQELADRAGVSRETIIRIEAENSSVTVHQLEKVRIAFESCGLRFSNPEGVFGPALSEKTSTE